MKSSLFMLLIFVLGLSLTNTSCKKKDPKPQIDQNDSGDSGNNDNDSLNLEDNDTTLIDTSVAFVPSTFEKIKGTWYLHRSFSEHTTRNITYMDLFLNPNSDKVEVLRQEALSDSTVNIFTQGFFTQRSFPTENRVELSETHLSYYEIERLTEDSLILFYDYYTLKYRAILTRSPQAAMTEKNINWELTLHQPLLTANDFSVRTSSQTMDDSITTILSSTTLSYSGSHYVPLVQGHEHTDLQVLFKRDEFSQGDTEITYSFLVTDDQGHEFQRIDQKTECLAGSCEGVDPYYPVACELKIFF